MHVNFNFIDPRKHPSRVTIEDENSSIQWNFHPDTLNPYRLSWQCNDVLYNINLRPTPRPTGVLYNQKDPDSIPHIERLRCKFPHKLKDEDKTLLKLKYGIDVSILEFKSRDELTEESIKRIRDRVYELAVEYCHTNDDIVVWLWYENYKAHKELAQAKKDKL